MSCQGWEQPVATRRPHRNTSAGSDAHQRSFTGAGNRPKVVSRPHRFDTAKRSQRIGQRFRLMQRLHQDSNIRFSYKL